MSFPTWFAPVLPIQREATKITGWDNGAVPGLQQTEDYARALVKARRPHDDEESIERTVRGRMERQASLVRPNPPKLTHIIHEGALRHVIGGSEVMADQLDKLIKTGDAPGTVIQVLPYSAHDHAGVEGLLYLYKRTGQPDGPQCDRHRRGQHRQRHVHSQQQRPRQPPAAMRPAAARRRPTRGLWPPASWESAANPVKIGVSTVVVTSGTARRRTVAFCSPSLAASNPITTYRRAPPASTGSPTATTPATGCTRQSGWAAWS
jgi:hypothetical protein